MGRMTVPIVRQLKPSSMKIKTPNKAVVSSVARLFLSRFSAHRPYAAVPPDLPTSVITAHKSAKKMIIYALSAIFCAIMSNMRENTAMNGSCADTT